MPQRVGIYRCSRVPAPSVVSRTFFGNLGAASASHRSLVTLRVSAGCDGGEEVPVICRRRSQTSAAPSGPSEPRELGSRLSDTLRCR